MKYFTFTALDVHIEDFFCIAQRKRKNGIINQDDENCAIVKSDFA